MEIDCPEKPIVWAVMDQGELRQEGYSGPLGYIEATVDALDNADDFVGSLKEGVSVVEVTIPPINQSTYALDEDLWEFRVLEHQSFAEVSNAS